MGERFLQISDDRSWAVLFHTTQSIEEIGDHRLHGRTTARVLKAHILHWVNWRLLRGDHGAKVRDLGCIAAVFRAWRLNDAVREVCRRAPADCVDSRGLGRLLWLRLLAPHERFDLRLADVFKNRVQKRFLGRLFRLCAAQLVDLASDDSRGVGLQVLQK